VPKLRVHNFSVSVDGYAAGPDQSRETRWVFAGKSYTTGVCQPKGYAVAEFVGTPAALHVRLVRKG
jgi:hypothetical protein